MALFFHSDDVDQMIPIGEAVEITERALRDMIRLWRLRAAQTAQSSSQCRRRHVRYGAKHLRRRFGSLRRRRRAGGAASKGDHRQYAETAAV